MKRGGLIRILTAIVGIPLFIAPMYLGGTGFAILIFVVSAAGQYELYKLQTRLSWNPNIVAGLIMAIFVVLRDYIEFAVPAVLLILVFLFLESTLTGPDRNPLVRISSTLIGVIYPALFLSFLPIIRSGLEPGLGHTDAFLFVFLLIGLIWVCDTSAYYIGRAIGKTALSPAISPKKTVEGAIGGVAGAFVAAVAVRFFLLPFLSWTDVAVFALIAGVVGQMGDLVESAFKRAADVKDSGTLLPGHGGFLDRFDSIIVATPVYYLYLTLATNYM